MLVDLLQTYGYAASETGNHVMDNFTTSESFFLIIVVGILGFMVQARLKNVFARYSKVPSPNGMSGAEAAERMLKEHHINNVTITHVRGQLTDHFNPATMTVNLSDDVYSGRSISALAVACHECGHAIQHAEEYAPLKLRSAMVPMVNFSSRIATWLIIIGLVLMGNSGNDTLCWIGIGLISLSAVFSLITLPVEFNASSRAIEWLEETCILRGENLEGARVALRWAARTYVVAAISSIATILYYVTIVLNRRD